MGICKIQKVEIFVKLYTFVWIVSIHLLTDSGMRNKLRWKYLVRFKLSIVFSVVNAKSKEKFPRSSGIAHDAFINACTSSCEIRTLFIATVFLSIVFAVPTPAPVLVPVSPPSHPAPSSFIKTIETRPARPVPGPHTLIFIKILLRPWAHSHRQIARQCQQLGREYDGENVTNLMHDGCSILMNINNKRDWKTKLCFCNWNAQIKCISFPPLYSVSVSFRL